MIRWLIYAFETPSAFPNDARKYAINVLGHAIVVGGIPAALFAIFAHVIVVHLSDWAGVTLPAVAAQWFGLVLTAVLYAAWEMAQFQFMRASAPDGLSDWAFVMLGHLTVATLNPALFVIFLAYFASGVLSRQRRETFYF